MSDQDLKHNPFDQDEDKYEAEVPTATLQIYAGIKEGLARPKDTHVNRASSANYCYKRRWYQRNGYEGTGLTPRKIVNFLLGDLAEKSLLFFIKESCVGPGKLYSEVSLGVPIGGFKAQGKDIVAYEQETLSATIAGIPFTAHVDGWGKRNSDGAWELIEIKSAANWGYDDFKASGPGDYLKQAHVNLSTTKAKELGARSVRFFYLRKESGNLYDRVFDFNPEIYATVEREALLANQDAEPERPPYPMEEEEIGQGRGRPKLKTGRMLLGFPCNGYCSFTATCYPGAKVEWDEGRHGFKKPKYVIEKKE